MITFDSTRAKQGLWPAVDPLRSNSSISPSFIDQSHAELAAQARSLLSRYQDIQHIVEHSGLDGLHTPSDRTDAERARKLHRYLTQPLPGAEPWTGVPGQHVSIENTLSDCRAILDGKFDARSEESFFFLGTA